LNEALASLVPIGTSVPKAQSPQTHTKKISKPTSKTENRHHQIGKQKARGSATGMAHTAIDKKKFASIQQQQQTASQNRKIKSMGLSPNARPTRPEERRGRRLPEKAQGSKMAIKRGSQSWAQRKKGGVQ
jgi:hypothetical protein